MPDSSMTITIKPGTVFWITGLSGTGKSTIANSLANRIRQLNQSIILLDGDRLREVFDGMGCRYDFEGRKTLSLCYARMCCMLASQGINVICATISLFHEIQKWNRTHIHKYFEIYVRVKPELLFTRDPNKLYSRIKNGQINNVVGIDVPYEEPINPELIIDNDYQCNVEEIIDRIIHKEGSFESISEFN